MAAIQQPRHPKAVGAVAMQKTRGIFAVKINKIPFRNTAQLIEIKIGV